MTSPRPMSIEHFEALLDTHGPHLSRFPEPDRSAAHELLARDADARRALVAAKRLAHALDALPSPEPSAALRRAVAEIPLRHPRPVSAQARSFAAHWSPLASARRMFVAALAVAMLGAATGSLTAATSPVASANEDEWDDLSALAFASDLDLDEDASP